MIAWSLVCPIRKQCSQDKLADRPSRQAQSIVDKHFPLPLSQEELVVHYWALNTGKLPHGGLPRNSVV